MGGPMGGRTGRSMGGSVGDGLRLGLGTLSVLPVRAGPVDRRTAGQAMLWAPALGALLGAGAGGLGWAGTAVGLSSPTAAVLTIAGLAALTRGLHLDGLADTADGLGCGRGPGEALRVMRAPDVGPFGVATLVLVLLTQIGALAEVGGSGPHLLAATVLAAAAGRLPLVWACRPAVPAAHRDGLGALVAGTVSTGRAVAVTALTLLTGLGLAAVSDLDAARVGAALALSSLTAVTLLAHCRRRFGGLTGDVLGAMVETATASALLTLATT